MLYSLNKTMINLNQDGIILEHEYNHSQIYNLTKVEWKLKYMNKRNKNTCIIIWIKHGFYYTKTGKYLKR